MLKSIRHAWLLLPCLPYLILSAQHCPNLPILDDYEAILQTILKWKNGNLCQKVEVLFSQHGDHRILYSRIVYVLYYSIFGNIDFHNLMFLGNCNLVIVSAFMIYFIRRTGVKYWQIPALVSVFLICDPNTYESATIAMYSWQNHGIVALFFATLFFWHKKWMAPAIISQFLLILSSGNGMIGAAGISIYALTLGRRYAIACGVFFIAFTGLYFVDYVHYEDTTLLSFDIGTATKFFIRMTGCPFSFDNSMFYGFIILLAIPFLIPIKHINTHKSLFPILGLLFFILGSEATTAWFRSCTQYAQFQTSRYQIYPQMLIAILIVLLLSRGKKYLQWTAYGLMSIWMLVYYPFNYKFGELGFIRTEARVTMIHGSGPVGDKYWHPEKEKAAQISKAACDEGIYCLEDNR